MEKPQAIVSLRAPGYRQAVPRTWVREEPAGWMNERIAGHQAIHDDLIRILRGVPSLAVRARDRQLPVPAPARAGRITARLRAHPARAGWRHRHPGTEFSPHADDSIRLNFSQNHTAAVHAIERTAQLIERYRAWKRDRAGASVVVQAELVDDAMGHRRRIRRWPRTAARSACRRARRRSCRLRWPHDEWSDAADGQRGVEYGIVPADVLEPEMRDDAD